MDLREVISHAARLGDILYLATASADGAPHVVPLSGGWFDQRLYMSIGTRSRTRRNLTENPQALVHFEVTEEHDWDSLLVWGDPQILDSGEDKRRLWTGVLPYDLGDFEAGGPSDSPETVFLEIVPTRALLLYHYGEKGRDEWRLTSDV